MRTEGDAAHPPALDPEFVTSVPNEAVTLHGGGMTLRQAGLELVGNGKLTLAWLPSPMVTFEVEGSAAGTAGSVDLGSATISVPALDLIVDVEIDSVSADERVVKGRTGHITSGDPSSLSRITFHLVNFPAYVGEVVTRSAGGRRSTWGGRVSAEVGPWTLTLDEIDDSHRLEKQVKEQAGYAITHIGSVSRSDGASFDALDAQPLIAAFFHVASFCRGGWAPPTLWAGTDASGRMTWRRWGIWKCDTFKPKFTWFPRSHPTALADILGAAFARWDDADWRAAMVIAWGFCIEATHVLGNEPGLLLAQAGMELLATRARVEGKSAGERIRKLLRRAEIPEGIPSSLGRLSAYAAEQRWKDGPQAIVEVRNRIVHSTNPALLFESRWPGTDARRLAVWYLELLLLFELSYSGVFEDHIDWSGDVKPVPWAKTTARTTGDLPQNGGNSQS